MEATHTVSLALQKAAAACDGQAGLAQKLNLTGPSPRATVWAWIDRGRVPIEQCAEIERVSNGAATRRDLRPDDWWLIWPELITAEHPVPARQEAA